MLTDPFFLGQFKETGSADSTICLSEIFLKYSFKVSKTESMSMKVRKNALERRIQCKLIKKFYPTTPLTLNDMKEKGPKNV